MVESRLSTRSRGMVDVNELLALDDRKLKLLQVDQDPRKHQLKALMTKRINDIMMENEHFKDKM